MIAIATAIAKNFFDARQVKIARYGSEVDNAKAKADASVLILATWVMHRQASAILCAIR